jgi:hypothetical protein
MALPLLTEAGSFWCQARENPRMFGRRALDAAQAGMATGRRALRIDPRESRRDWQMTKGVTV